MKIIVGSQNAAKVGAVKAAADAYWRDNHVWGVEADSGVPGQPKGWEETMRGALNRARNAYYAADGKADLGVGLEGGVVEMAGRMVLMNVAAVFDGRQESAAPGTGTPLPESWAVAVRGGQELGPFLAEKFAGYNRKIGAMPFVTNGVLQREAIFTEALKGALAPWVTPEAFAA